MNSAIYLFKFTMQRAAHGGVFFVFKQTEMFHIQSVLPAIDRGHLSDIYHYAAYNQAANARKNDGFNVQLELYTKEGYDKAFKDWK